MNPTPSGAVGAEAASPELLPCPFCGELDDLSVETHEHSSDWETNYVHCPCGAEGPAKGNRGWAIAGWNRRAAQPAAPAVLAEPVGWMRSDPFGNLQTTSEGDDGAFQVFRHPASQARSPLTETQGEGQ